MAGSSSGDTLSKHGTSWTETNDQGHNNPQSTDDLEQSKHRCNLWLQKAEMQRQANQLDSEIAFERLCCDLHGNHSVQCYR